VDSTQAAVAAFEFYPEAPLGYTRRMDRHRNMTYPNREEHD